MDGRIGYAKFFGPATPGAEWSGPAPPRAVGAGRGIRTRLGYCDPTLTETA